MEIKHRLKEEDFATNGDKPNPQAWADLLEYDQGFKDEFNNVVDDPEVKEADNEYKPKVFEYTYLNMELVLSRDEPGPEFALVTKRLWDKDGLPNGRSHNNPILDTQMNEVEFPGGYKLAVLANAIAQSMFAQVDEQGNWRVLFQEIVACHCTPEAVTQDGAFVVSNGAAKCWQETTKGRELLVQRKDKSTTWVTLKDIKQAYPVQVAK